MNPLLKMEIYFSLITTSAGTCWMSTIFDSECLSAGTWSMLDVIVPGLSMDVRQLTLYILIRLLRLNGGPVTTGLWAESRNRIEADRAI
jgi:hypothetical protein